MKTVGIPARKVQRGMTVILPDSDAPETEWHVLERHPQRGCWWLHRRDNAGEWVTTHARFSEMVQII